MDPPEVHVTITAASWVPSGPATPTPTIKTTRRGGPIAVAFGFHRTCRSEGRRLPSSSRARLHSNRGREQATDFNWPGGSRGSDSELKVSDGRFSPANRPARNSGARPKGETWSNEQSQSLGRVRAGIQLRWLLSTAWRPSIKASAERKNPQLRRVERRNCRLPESGAFLKPTWGDRLGAIPVHSGSGTPRHF